MKLEVTNLDNGIKQIKLNGQLDIPGTSAVENSFTVHVTSKKAPVLARCR